MRITNLSCNYISCICIKTLQKVQFLNILLLYTLQHQSISRISLIQELRKANGHSHALPGLLHGAGTESGRADRMPCCGPEAEHLYLGSG